MEFRTLSVACFTMLVVATSNPVTAQWSVIPTLTLAGNYTDNVTLAPAGQEEAEFVTQVAPGISIRGNSQRNVLLLDYRLQGLLYSEDSRRNAVFNQLQADTTSKVLGDFLFFDTSATIAQRIVDATRVVSSNFTDNENLSDVFAVSFSPHVRHAFGSTALGALRYNYGVVDFESEQQSDSDSDIQQLSGLLESGPAFTRVDWALSYDHDRFDFANNDQVVLEEASLEVGYLLIPALRLFASGGFENIDTTDSTLIEPDGAIWDAGVSWAVSPRTTLTGSYGDRFFGERFFGQLTHETTRSSWSVEYSEDVTTVTEAELVEPVFLRNDPFGNPLLRGRISAGGIVNPTVEPDPFVERSFSSSLALRFGRTTFQLTVFDQRREFITSVDTEQVRGFRSNLEWRFAGASELEFFGQWLTRDLITTAPDEIIWQAGARYNRLIRPNLTATLEYRHFRFDTDVVMDESTENVISLTIEKLFQVRERAGAENAQ